MEQLFVDYICASCNADGVKNPERRFLFNKYLNKGSYAYLSEDANSNIDDIHSPPEGSDRDLIALYSAEKVRNFRFQNLLVVEKSNYSQYFLTRKLCDLVHCLQLKTNFGYRRIPDKIILNDDRVLEAVDRSVTEQLETEYTKESYSRLLKIEKKNAANILKNMKDALSSTFIRITGYVLFKVFKWMFTSVIVNEKQLEMIKTASKRNLPMIFVPLHRSHIDYLFVSWVLFNMEVHAPLVAAGDNLRLPVFGNLLRSLGGFFIKRKMESSKDRNGYVYRSVLQTYMSRSLISGYHLEFFIEGGRTRSGKPCMPKGGLLSVVVDAFLSGHLCDALIVPIAINYDKLIDGAFITEQLGHNKVPETFWGAVRAIVKTLRTNFGMARIDFNQPFSLKEYYLSTKIKLSNLSENKTELCIDEDTSHRNHSRSLSGASSEEQNVALHEATSNSSLFGSVVSDDYRKFVKMLGSHILYDAERCQAIMATNLVAWLLSFAYRDGTSLLSLVDEFHLLKQSLLEGGRDMGFSGPPVDVVLYAIDMLGNNLVHVDGVLDPNNLAATFIRPITELPGIIELNYYANALLPIFAIDCITATALLSLIECDLSTYIDVSTVFTIKESQLSSISMKLSDLLSYEFVLTPPCNDLRSKIANSIDQIAIGGLLVSNEEGNYPRRQYYDEDSEDDFVIEPYFKLKPNASSLKKIKILTRALAPIIEAYYSTACNLVTLIDKPVTEKEFISSTQNLICNLIDSNGITYGESVAADPIRNALKKFEEEHVIESYISESKKVICLNKAFESQELLYPIIREICLYKV